jgi:ketosteroid isomerase-like protein
VKRFCLVATLVVVAGLVTGGVADTRAATADEMVKAANALDQAFVTAFNQGDIAAIAGLYWNSPDVVMFPPAAMMQKGSEAIKTGMGAMFAAMPGCTFAYTESHQIPAGDMVIGWGLWSMTMPGADGSSVTMTGRYTDVKAMRNGKMVYILDHASVPMSETGGGGDVD